MSRFLALTVFAIWMSSPAAPAVHGMGTWAAIAAFIGGYALIVLALRLCSAHVAQGSHSNQIQQRLLRFNQLMYGARVLIPSWFAVGIFCLGWKTLVQGSLEHTGLGKLTIESPGLLLGSLPAFAALMGLWWAQYPADRAVRDRNVSTQLGHGIPVHEPPGFWSYIGTQIRLGLLFTVAPAVILVALRDVLSLALPPLLNHTEFIRQRQGIVDAIISLPSLVGVLVLGPELLRRVLHTESMPDCPLRRRLEEICRRCGVGYRDVLLWHTRNQMGNAAVMGFVPRFRYILLSDLLLESMGDEQIAAVFAHEIGHVMHRHMLWLCAAMGAVLLAIAGPGQSIAALADSIHNHAWAKESLEAAVLTVLGLAGFMTVFGYVSRKFERQADVFAARTIQGAFEAQAALIDPSGTSGDAKPHVGHYGAMVFCSALARVASVNNIPIAARSWCHGSIARRMSFLRELGHDSARTVHFDRFMTRLNLGLLCSLGIFGVWTILTMV